MHEFVLSARTLKREHGITAPDVAKRLMDFGFHPPTVYFPLVVPEALMIEPTETEAKETLDAFAEAMIEIAREAAEEPDEVGRRPTAGRSAGSTRPAPRSSSSSGTRSARPERRVVRRLRESRLLFRRRCRGAGVFGAVVAATARPGVRVARADDRVQ